MFPQELTDVRGRNFLLALDEHRNGYRRRTVPSQQRGGVRRDSGLIIGGTTAEQPAVAFRRLERLRGPQIRRSGRLDVVMRIKQDRRRSGGPRRPAEYRRMRAVYFEQADTPEARLFKPRAGLFGGPAHLIWVVGFVA